MPPKKSGTESGTLSAIQRRSQRVTPRHEVQKTRYFPRSTKSLVPPAGFEPATCSLGMSCSIQLSYGGVWLGKKHYPSSVLVRK